jgi:hypothetical protein
VSFFNRKGANTAKKISKNSAVSAHLRLKTKKGAPSAPLYFTISLLHHFTISPLPLFTQLQNKKGIHVEPLFVNLQGKF